MARKPADSSAGRVRPASRGAAGKGGNRLPETVFERSAHVPRDFPPPGPPEVAFAGRSNAGKSSAINALAGRRRLAFASKTPGRTQLINFFVAGAGLRVVDLPGYGYAGVPEKMRMHWRDLVGGYIRERAALAGIFLIVDARHGLTPLDHALLGYLDPARHRVHVLLTKSDKLSAQAARRALDAVRRDLQALHPEATVQLFSALRRVGIAEALAVVARWRRDAGPVEGDGQQKAPAKGEFRRGQMP